MKVYHDMPHDGRIKKVEWSLPSKGWVWQVVRFPRILGRIESLFNGSGDSLPNYE